MILKKTVRKRRNNNLNNNDKKILISNKYYKVGIVKFFRNLCIFFGVLSLLLSIAITLSVGVIFGIIFLLVSIFLFFSAFTYNDAIKKSLNSNQTSSSPTSFIPVSSHQETAKSSLPMQYGDKRILHALPRTRDGIPIAYEYTDVKICLIRGQEPDLTAIQVGSIIKLQQEPLNQYDNKAVMLKIGTTKIGYMYRGKLQDMANDFLNRHKSIVAYVSKIDTISNEIFMNIGFYRKPFKRYENSTTFKLTGNTNKDMQEIIQWANDDADVEFYYDYEKEKFCASIFGGDIGYAPKSKNDLLEACEEDYEACIESIEENDNGKYVVSVTVKY